MKIVIETIPHKSQRYPTCGDWYMEGDSLRIKISEEMPKESQQLVAIHELIEAVLCQKSGVTPEAVDAFDIQFEKNRPKGSDDEPGDSPDAPYERQHNIATGIESILCAELGIKWKHHSDAVEALE